MSSGRQGSIANFLKRTPTKPVAAKKEVKDEVIDLTSSLEPASAEHVEETGPSPKRRKLSPEPYPKVPCDDYDLKGLPVQTVGGSKSSSSRLTLDTTEKFTYPGADHVSYSSPPSPAYNHPFSISPPPLSLLEKLSFSQSPRAILKPNLNLDLLYFDQFIASPGSRELYDYLLDSLPWYRVKYTTRGIDINTPRWTTVFGKDSSTKSWTGYNVKPRAIPEILLRLMEIGTPLSSAIELDLMP